jgi:hypothetical protein
MERMAYGWSPEELHFQHPYLTLGQIFSALAYYYDHQAAIDEDIARRRQFADEMRQRAVTSPFAQRLKSTGKS